MYANFPNMCGTGDTDDFVAADLCCSCGGGSTADQQTCEDTAGDNLDDDGFGCNWYNTNPEDCESGEFDNSDFVAADMCCGCGGGKRNDFDPATAEVSTVAEILDQADNAADVALAIIHNPQAIFSIFGGGGNDDDDEGVVAQDQEQ